MISAGHDTCLTFVQGGGSWIWRFGSPDNLSWYGSHASLLKIPLRIPASMPDDSSEGLEAVQFLLSCRFPKGQPRFYLFRIYRIDYSQRFYQTLKYLFNSRRDDICRSLI